MEKIFKTYKKQIITLLLFLIFKPLFDNYITETIVYIIDKNINYLFTELIFYFLVISLLILTINKIKKNYFISYDKIIWGILIVIIYFFYRLEFNNWQLISLKSIHFIKLLDIIPISIILLFIIKIFYKEKKKETKENGFYIDKALRKEGEDKLNRTKLAENIIKRISNTNLTDGSFAFGIVGEWGSGKTSFLNIIENKINPNEYILIKYNPWLNNNSNSIIKDFFITLKDELSQYNSEIYNNIDKYIDIILNETAGNYNKIIKQIINKSSQKPIYKEYNSLDNAINKLDKRLLIVIDDLDRLYSDEIIQVLKLIRNTASFRNTYFIVTYDKTYIKKSLLNINQDTEYYLEKIFQVEIQLPVIEKQIIRKELFDLIKKHIDKKELEKGEKIILANNLTIVDDVVNINSIKTIRDVKRFVNSFVISYDLLKGDVELVDLLNVEILRLKYIQVYKLLFEKRDDFLLQKTNTYSEPCYVLKKDEEDNLVIIKHLTKQNIILSTKVNDVKELLHSLFSDDNEKFIMRKSSHLSISNPRSFDRYYLLRLLDNELSYVEFTDMMLKPISEIKEQISIWLDKGFGIDLVYYLQHIYVFQNKEDYEKTIQAIFYIGYYQVKNEINDVYIEQDVLSKRISNYNNEIVKRFYNENEKEHYNFILKQFTNAPSPYIFEVDFIYTLLSKNKERDDYIITNNVFKEIVLKYFKDYIKNNINWNKYLWKLYFINILIFKNLKKQDDNTKIKDLEVSKMLVSFIKDYSLNDFVKFVIKSVEFDDGYYGIYETIPEIFGSYDNFKNFIHQFDNTKYSNLKEFKLFYSKLEEVGYTKSIKFKFNEINI